MPPERRRGAAWLIDTTILDGSVDLIKSSEDAAGVLPTRDGRCRAAPAFFGDTRSRVAFETDAAQQLALEATAAHLKALRASGAPDSDVDAAQGVAAVPDAPGSVRALALDLRRDAEAVRTQDLKLYANPGNPKV